MTGISLGDLAQSLQLRKDNVRLRGEIDRLSQELSSGRKSDVTSAVSGDFGALSGLESSRVRIESFELAVNETRLSVSTTQEVLGRIQTNMSDVSSALLLAQENVQPSFVNNAAADARVRLDSVVASLNTRIADRSLFAGAATDGPALADAQIMLDEITTLIAAETTAAGVEGVIDTYFAPGGGFETSGYLGSTDPISSVQVSDTEQVNFPITASDTELRGVLAAFSKVAILDEGALNALPEERAILARRAGEAMLSADAGLVAMRADVGAREAQVDRVATGLAAERESVDLAISQIVAVDPFDVAVQLKSAENQLEAFYTLTARMANLSLTSFLR